MGGTRLILLGALAVPLLGLALLLAAPGVDVRWEDHPSHFWLVLATAALNAALAYGTGVAARKRRDRRVHLVSLAFLAAAGFLALHALATPGVLLDKSNLGFVIATPIGLLVAGALSAFSAVETARVRPALLEAGVLASLAVWAALSLLLLPDVDDAAIPARLSLPLVVLCAVGVLLYAFAVSRYLALYRTRRSPLVLGFTLAFVLLAEAMVAIALGRNWQASWWEWHVLMLTAFALIAVMAHREGPEERFGRLYGERQPVLTVLFADLKGFTSWSEGRDPREVSAMLDVQFAAVIPAIERRGGRVDRLIGDAVFALFDDAAAAAQAALELQERSGSLGEAHRDWPRFRVGLHTGKVDLGLVGTGSGRTYSALGDTVNLGSRIEGLAPPGGIALSAATASALPGATTEALGTVTVKGRAEPVEVLLLRGLPEG